MRSNGAKLDLENLQGRKGTRSNWPISSRLRFFKNHCFALVD
jgi:hypothetical protein